MKPVPYICRFCQKPGEALADDSCDDGWIAQLAPSLACNRCADYHTIRNKLIDRIQRISIRLMVARKMSETSDAASKELPDFERRVREKLVLWTKAYADIVCRFKNKLPQWEPDFMEMIFEKPWKHEFILKHYETHA